MTRLRAGVLIVLEGVDGCGKTTQAGRLATALDAVLTHEPGATALGSSLRALVLGGEGPVVGPRAEALLLAADRAQHVEEVVLPALEAGRTVVSDRFTGSTLAYQGYGRGLPLDALSRVVDWATGGLEADLNVLIDVEPEAARRRLRDTAPDRLERLDPAFFERVRQGYLSMADECPDRWLVVDGSGSVDEVAALVMAGVRGRFRGSAVPAP